MLSKRVLNTLTDVRHTEAGSWSIAGTAASTRRQHNLYVCGAPLFPPEHEVYSKVGVREDAECTTVIESSYYALSQVLIPEELLCV